MWTLNEGIVGTMGLEYGTIILDMEYDQKARISVERDTPTAPFSITIGISNLLFHTVFCSNVIEVIDQLSALKDLTQQILEALAFNQVERLSGLLDRLVRL